LACGGDAQGLISASRSPPRVRHDGYQAVPVYQLWPCSSPYTGTMGGGNAGGSCRAQTPAR
jgi:hypothetical protein